MDQAQNAQNASADWVKEMEEVPPHLDPIQQGAIISALQHQIAQMRLKIDRGMNQHLLRVQDNAPNVPWVLVDKVPLPEVPNHERQCI